MSAPFTRAQVEAIAALAHLELDAAEIDRFTRQLGEILTYISLLQEIDTSGVPPTVTVSADHAADRADLVVPSIDRRAALGNAPDAHAEAGLFRVPRVL